MKTTSVMVALSALLFLAVAVGCTAEEDDNDDLGTILDNGDRPSDPSLCEPACRALTGFCATVDDEPEQDKKPDIELMRACMRSCENGSFDDDELECLAELECTDFNNCLD